MLKGLRNRLFGDLGERLAARHLRRQGYKILARQWRGRMGEVDLIARQGQTIVFVEVKTRRPDPGSRPEEAVDRNKQRQLTRAGYEWMKRHGREGWSYRFDVVAIVLPESGDPQVKHIIGAFEAVE